MILAPIKTDSITVDFSQETGGEGYLLCVNINSINTDKNLHFFYKSNNEIANQLCFFSNRPGE